MLAMSDYVSSELFSLRFFSLRFFAARRLTRFTDKMKNIAAYLLLTLGGNASPSADDISKVITAAGGEAEAEQIAKLLAQFEGKNVDEIVAAGKAKIGSVPTGAAPAASSGAAPSGAAPAAAAGKAAAAEEPKKKSSSSEHGDLGGGLFGGDVSFLFFVLLLLFCSHFNLGWLVNTSASQLFMFNSCLAK
jgi:large subunit ribosomal protein LP2